MFRCVAWVIRNNVSEECTKYIFVVEGEKEIFGKRTASKIVLTECLATYIQGKGKVRPRTGHVGPEEEQMYGCTFSLTLALDGLGGQRHVPAVLPTGKRLGGPKGRSVRVRKISPPLEFNLRTVQSVASRYTDYTIPVHVFNTSLNEIVNGLLYRSRKSLNFRCCNKTNTRHSTVSSSFSRLPMLLRQ
jgi:hypothetical protein